MSRWLYQLSYGPVQKVDTYIKMSAPKCQGKRRTGMPQETQTTTPRKTGSSGALGRGVFKEN